MQYTCMCTYIYSVVAVDIKQIIFVGDGKSSECNQTDTDPD